MPASDSIRSVDLSDDLDLLRGAAEEAGAIAMGYFRKNPEVWMKTGQSPVTEADYAVDRFLRETLMAARPEYGWLSEETVDTEGRLSARRTFVVDPIDGTRGFIDGRTNWCVSIAVVDRGEPVVGVLECPARNETFWATAGSAAHRDGQMIRVREPGARYEIAGAKQFVDKVPVNWREKIQRVGHIPSLAYRLAMIAQGSLDAIFVKPQAHDWDLAAADLIVREAGGQVLDAQGKPPVYGGADPRKGPLVAGSGRFLEVIAGVIAARDG